ncbi:MAG: hypothetical protein AAGA23_18335 [Pseudomonadota bacterium]
MSGTKPPPQDLTPAPPRFAAWVRWLIFATLLLAALSLVALSLLDLEMDLEKMLRDARQTPQLLITSGVVYALLLALPYMPGMELGLLIMMVFGRAGAITAWLATVVGLNLAFAVGLYLRGHLSNSPLAQRWRHRAETFETDRDAAVGRYPFTARLAATLRRRKGISDYLLLALLFNLPGNIVLGGGGGIALLAALSGRLHWRGFALTVMLATSVIPLLAVLGLIDLQAWLSRFH